MTEDPSNLPAMPKAKGSHTRPDSQWYSTPTEKRRRKGIMFTLSPETLRKLAKLAEASGESRSQVVDRLVMAAKS